MSQPPRVTRRRLLEYWWTLPVAATVGALGYMGFYAARVTFGKRGAGEPDYQPKAPGRVAAPEQLGSDWASLDFTYAGTPCVLLRLPSPAAHGLTLQGRHYAAYSRVCTHLGCSVNLQRDLDVVAFSFNYRADHPMLGCPCHFSLFDPLKEGDVAIGKALYPLPRVRLEARGGALYATGIEPPPKA